MSATSHKPTSDRTNEPILPLSPSTSTPRDYSTISQPQPPTHDAPQDGTSGTLARPSNPSRPSTTAAARAAAALETRDASAWTAFWEKYGSVELENKGSVARDHLALGKHTSSHLLPTHLLE